MDTKTVDARLITQNVEDVAAQFARERSARQRRRVLLPADFEQIKQTGFLLTGVPRDHGGLWESLATSTRYVCELLRTLGHGDSSVALVCAMHPAVLLFWLATPQAPVPFDEAWNQQRRRVLQTATEGAWWGTITSEPGSGGDITKTRATASGAGAAAGYLLSGQKQFGSGSGITSYMLTTARPEDEQEPDWFFLDVTGAPWDGTAGMTLVAEWDGHGMIATQSHALRFDDYPATRVAWPGHMVDLMTATGGGIGCYFSAVIVGIVETAIATARQQVAHRRTTLRVYEQGEWARAELEGWLIQQAYEGMLRAIETQGAAGDAVLHGKTAIAELAEAALGRLCKVLGGGTYGGRAPFGWWFEDVRALGFLRPPWGLAYDTILEASWRRAEEGNTA